MVGTDSMINAFTTLLVTVDPPGLAPLFLGLTQGMTRGERRQVAVRGSVIAFAILTVFALFGASILSALGISMGAFRIAGGLMLFAISFEMIFEKRNERKEKTTDAAITKDHIHNLAVFPLAIPLIAGPGAISATVLIAGTMGRRRRQGAADRRHRRVSGARLCRTDPRRAAQPLPRRHRSGTADPAARRASVGAVGAVRGRRREIRLRCLTRGAPSEMPVGR